VCVSAEIRQRPGAQAQADDTRLEKKTCIVNNMYMSFLESLEPQYTEVHAIRTYLRAQFGRINAPKPSSIRGRENMAQKNYQGAHAITDVPLTALKHFRGVAKPVD
jgi:hypothetical protein